MDIKKFVVENGLSDFPIGLGGCRISDFHFNLCAYDVVVFDGKLEPEKITKSGDEFLIIHHASLSETLSKKLLQYDKLQIIQDESWDLRMLLSKINEKRSSLFTDFAKNCLIESMFCCQKTKEAIQNSLMKNTQSHLKENELKILKLKKLQDFLTMVKFKLKLQSQIQN